MPQPRHFRSVVRTHQHIRHRDRTGRSRVGAVRPEPQSLVLSLFCRGRVGAVLVGCVWARHEGAPRTSWALTSVLSRPVRRPCGRRRARQIRVSRAVESRSQTGSGNALDITGMLFTTGCSRVNAAPPPNFNSLFYCALVVEVRMAWRHL
jgi:hypothetical protein